MALNYEFENKSKRRINIDDLENGDLFIYDHTLFMLLSNSGGYGFFTLTKKMKKVNVVEQYLLQLICQTAL